MDPSPAIPRRRFVKLLAASAASLAMTSDPARAAAKTAERHRAAASAPPKSTALDKELRTEKKNVADMLKVVRSYKLPAGSPPAMAFRPMKARRGRTS
jgi:hypothetical protein